MELLSTHGKTGSGSTMADLLKGRFGKKLRKKDFTINRPQTLFGPDWSQLKDGRCPHCCNRLVMIPSRKGYVRCLSKRHKKSFVIHRDKIKEILDSLTSGV